MLPAPVRLTWLTVLPVTSLVSTVLLPQSITTPRKSWLPAFTHSAPVAPAACPPIKLLLTSASLALVPGWKSMPVWAEVGTAAAL